MIDDKIRYVCLSANVQENQLLFGNIRDDFLGFPRIELIN
jgi:hypothetical protein